MALTYTAIATVTVGSGGAANIEFTSIPGTYTDLLLKASTRGVSTDDLIVISFNGSSANQTQRYLTGNGSSASSNNTTNLWGVNNQSGTTASTFSNNEIYIPNYAGSTNKSLSLDGVTENNATSAYTWLMGGLWSQTAAITSITITTGGGNFAQYSTATLYGIKATV